MPYMFLISDINFPKLTLGNTSNNTYKYLFFNQSKVYNFV